MGGVLRRVGLWVVEGSILFGTKVGGMGSKGEGRVEGVENCTIAGSMFVPPCHVHLPLI